MIPVTWLEAVLSFWRPGRRAPPRLSCGGAQGESGDPSVEETFNTRYAEPGNPGHKKTLTVHRTKMEASNISQSIVGGCFYPEQYIGALDIDYFRKNVHTKFRGNFTATVHYYSPFHRYCTNLIQIFVGQE